MNDAADLGELHDSLVQGMTSPDFLRQHGVLAIPNPGDGQSYGADQSGRLFHGDESIDAFTKNVGDTYEETMRRAGAPEDKLKEGRKAFEEEANKRARTFAVEHFAGNVGGPPEAYRYAPVVGHLAAAKTDSERQAAVERVQKGEGSGSDYLTIGQLVAHEREVGGRGWLAKTGYGALGLAQFASEMGMTGGAGWGLGKAGVAALGGGKALQFAGAGLGATAAMPQRSLSGYAESGTPQVGTDEDGKLAFSKPDSRQARAFKTLASDYIDNTVFPAVGLFDKGTGGYAGRVLKKALVGLFTGEATQDFKKLAQISPQGSPLSRLVIADPQGRLQALKDLAGEAVSMGLMESVVQAGQRKGLSEERVAKNLQAQLEDGIHKAEWEYKGQWRDHARLEGEAIPPAEPDVQDAEIVEPRALPGPDTPQDAEFQQAEPQKALPPSPEEAMRQKLTRSKEFPDIGNRLGFDEAQQKDPAPAVAVTDVDKLGEVAKENRPAVMRAKIDALKQAGLEPFHGGGPESDEFMVRGGTDELHAKLDQARQILKAQTGQDFSFGVGKTLGEADNAMRDAKQAKKPTASAEESPEEYLHRLGGLLRRQGASPKRAESAVRYWLENNKGESWSQWVKDKGIALGKTLDRYAKAYAEVASKPMDTTPEGVQKEQTEHDRLVNAGREYASEPGVAASLRPAFEQGLQRSFQDGQALGASENARASAAAHAPPETPAAVPQTSSDKLTPEQAAVHYAADLLKGESGAVDLDRLKQVAAAALARLRAGVQSITGTSKGSYIQSLTEAGTDVLRHRRAEQIASQEADALAVDKGRKFFQGHIEAQDGPTKKQRFLDFFLPIEWGRLQDVPKEQQEYAKVYRKIKDQYTEGLVSRGLTDDVIDDHVGHLWRDPQNPNASADEIAAKLRARRPLSGKEGYRKQRVLEDFQEGFDAGLEPVEWNPMEYALREWDQYSRSIFGHDAVKDFVDQGLAAYVKLGERPPPGWQSPKDKSFQVWVRGGAGPALLGNFYLPEPLARTVENHMSPGLGGYAAYRAFRGVGNQMSQFLLGWSGYHATATALNAQFTAAAESLGMLTRGDVGEAVKKLPEAIVPLYAAGRAVAKGRGIRKAWDTPGTGTPEEQQAVEWLKEAGGRVRGGSEYLGSQLDKLGSALRQIKAGKYGKVPEALARALPALNQLVSKPLMNQLVPLVKISAFTDAMRYEMSKRPTADLEERRAMSKPIWDAMDDRFGLLVYDNLFLHRVMRDALQSSFLSFGWNLGDVRGLGGGIADALKPSMWAGLAKGEGISRRTGFLVAMMAGTAMYGALYQLLRTGKPPEEPKDLWFPKNGEPNKDGTPMRVSIPGYSKDLANVVDRAGDSPIQVPRNIYHMVKGKISPTLKLFDDLLSNRDFRQSAIDDPSEPWEKQAKADAMHILSAFQPISVGQFRKRFEEGAPLDKQLEGFAGIVPAPYSQQHTNEQLREAESNKRRELTPLQKLRRSK